MLRRQGDFVASDLIVEAEFHNSSDLRSISNSNVIFAPTSDTSVETSHGTIKLAGGSVALVMANEAGLAIYDLHDNGKNSVMLETSSKRISLSPGRHVLISKTGSTEFESANTIELAQYRRLNQLKLTNGSKVYTSEFSIPSVCFAVKPLRNLMASKHSLAKRIMKTTAVLMTISPDRGDFVQYFKPRVTAMQ